MLTWLGSYKCVREDGWTAFSISTQVAIPTMKATEAVLSWQGAEEMGQMELLLNVYASQKARTMPCCNHADHMQDHTLRTQ